MNKQPVILFLLLLMMLPEASAAADMNLPATRKAAEPTPPGPVGTCTIYIQGRYSECEFTTEPACQRLSEMRNRPPRIAQRRWFALPQYGWGWDQPPCAGKVAKSALY